MNRKEIKKGRHSQEPLLGIFNACRGCLSLRKQQCVEDPRYQHSGMTASCGFTLIELLVVVLIIGILAAIALPQYSLTVEKSKSAELLLNLKAFVRAAESVYLETGSYPTDFTNLPISLQGTLQTVSDYENNMLTTPKGVSYLLEVYNDGQITAVKFDPYIQFNYIAKGINKGKLRCRAAKNDKTMNSVCKNLGGIFQQEINDQNWYWIE